MTSHAAPDDYRRFLDGQDLPTLRDWALDLARNRRDVAFLWDLTKHLPETQDVNRDWAVLDPVDAVRDLAHLFAHFREEAASPDIAPLLRARYVEYLLEHAAERRYDAAGRRATAD